MFCGDALVFGDNDLARFVEDVKFRHLAAQAVNPAVEKNAFLAEFKVVKFKKGLENLLMRHANCLEQNGHGHFAAAVDAEEQDVFRVELEIEP